MKNEKLEAHIDWLENLLQDFRKVKKRGKETNSNEERAQSIDEIEGITKNLEVYIRNNEDLLEMITGTEIVIAREVEWNDVVRPAHFDEDLEEEIRKLKQKVPN